MMKYDKESQVLKVQKVEPVRIEIDLLKDQKASYEKYIKGTIQKDVDHLCQQIMARTNVKNLTAVAKVGPLYSTRSKKEIKSKGNQYYPVSVVFYVNGEPRSSVELLKIPFMNDFCVLNVDGSEKVLLSELKSVEEISYDGKKKSLNIVLPHRMISIMANPKSIRFKLGENSIEADKVLMGFISADNADVVLKDYFRNSYILSTMTDLEFKTEGVIEDEISKTNIVERYRSENYRLGKLRKTLNARLTIDKSLGKILSRDIVLKKSDRTVEAGTVITSDLLKAFKRNLINEVYIRAVPRVVGWYLTEDITITNLRRSTVMNDFLKEELPRFSRFNYLPEDVETEIVIPFGTPLTSDILQTLFDEGRTEINCSSNKSLTNSRTIYFEQEIVGNCTAKLGDFLSHDEIPEGLSADDYTYYYGVEDPYTLTETINPDYITCHDLLALVSMVARIQTMPELNETFNRDIDFLKKVNLINETFSDSFREAIDPWMRKAKSTVEKFLLQAHRENDPFFGLNGEWIKIMRDKKLLRETEGVNPISLLTQANRIVTVASADSVPIEMRSLAMGFYGRICPYETPAGKNIGLLNTLAIGCKVVDGILLTPYLPVRKTARGCKIIPTPKYLTSTEEFELRIGDLLDVEVDKNWNLKNTKVTARVPAPAGHSEKTTVTTISAWELDYVNALPEQHLSPTAMLIPFAASDDGARVSFGLNLIRQSIYVQHSEVPLVTTSMYKNVFDYSDTYIHRAKKSGMVVAIESDTLILQYDGDPNETLVYVPETRVTNDAVTVMNYKVRAGDRFKEGQILVDSDVSREGFFSPGVNLLTAYIPWEGYNYEDAVVVAEKAANKFISISGNEVEKEIKHSDSEIININSGNYFKYIPEGGVITVIDRIKGADARRDSSEKMYAHRASGILYDIQSEVNDHGDRVCKAQLLGFNRLSPGDKMSGRHGNKGVNSLVEKNSNMPMFMNGRIVEAVLNPCGVVSRMNIGQELEGHAGFIAYLLGIRIESDPFNGATLQDIKNLMKFVYDLANNSDPNAAIAMNPGLPSGLYERAIERHSFIREWEGCFFKDGSAVMYDQQTGEMFEYPITFGMPYLLKIMHEVDDKVHARAGVMEEEYSMLEKQPTKGSSRGGGQRMGEMEGHAFLAHGAVEIMREMTNEKSDNVDLRVNLLMDMLGRDRLFQEGDTSPRTTEVLRYYLEVLGVRMEIDELPPVDYETVLKKTQFDAKALAKKIEEQNIKEIMKKENRQQSVMASLNDL